MSKVQTSKFYSDVELKIKSFLNSNLTDPIVNRGQKTPFVVIGSELQRDVQYPHVVIQLISGTATMFAVSSNGLVHKLIVQVMISSKNKKQLNEISDELLEIMRNGRQTMQSFGLWKMQSNYRKLTFDETTAVHRRVIDFSFVYHQM